MPGPSNTKKGSKTQRKVSKKAKPFQIQTVNEGERAHIIQYVEHRATNDDSQPDAPLFQPPIIHDPGNGPRVRNTREFVSSRFAQPPATSDPLCVEFAQTEVLEMLLTILPEEVAYILWYNKSRSTSRICPACLRLYHVGDILADHLPSQDPFEGMQSSPRLRREQSISGLCSAMCFIAAAFKYPSAIKPAWGYMAEELDEYTWNLLNGPPEGSTGDAGLSMLMRMTRLHDLGLAQLCFGLGIEDVDVPYQ